ncbi:hypothetical protein DVH02_10780 [Streptomyces corynorhini]|uniref:Uncharacterized protein n=1 Tax=Streptomyces corynorhini TaxID=2282652 RepID=A0A370BEM8_9ACTN|nr:hypothetical protein DVH02_10780 [Streptomyces corynorhini]
MPSLTVVVSSDTDICFSPGLYGLLADSLPTVQPARPRIHSGAAGACIPDGLSLFMLAHRPPHRNASHRRYRHRQSDVNRL